MLVGHIHRGRAWVQSQGHPLECEEAEVDAALSGGFAVAALTQVEEGRTTRVELYDSGATCHISPYCDDFITYQQLDLPLFLNTVNSQQFPAVGTGSMVVSTPNGAGQSDITLENVLHAPSVGYMLVSLGALDGLGYHIAIGHRHLNILSRAGECLARIVRTECSLYHVSHEGEGGYAVEVVSVMELHRRMGHIAPSSARKLVEDSLVTGLALDLNLWEEHCEVCIFMRATHQSVPKLQVSEQAHQFGDEIHTDVWGPAPVATRHGRRFFITFTDNATRFTLTYLLAAKSDAFTAYHQFKAWARTQNHCGAIKVLHSDPGGEYLSKAFNKHLADAGTAHQLTVHDTPQLNGIAKCLNRTLIEKVWSLLHMAGLPQSLWGEAIRQLTWLKNRTSMWALGSKMPWQALYRSPPNLSGLKHFGETVWVHNPTGSKLDLHACKGHWIGFNIESHGHHVYWPNNKLVSVECNVYFAAAEQLEGECMDVPTLQKSSKPLATPLPAPMVSAPPPQHAPLSPASSLSSLTSCSLSQAVSAELQLNDPEPEPVRPMCLRKLSQIVRELQAGIGVVSSHPLDPAVLKGVSVPGGFDEDNEGSVNLILGAWSVETGLPMLHESWAGFEMALVAETADSEALELQNLAEAKCRPDWLLWEQAIRDELDTLHTARTWMLEHAPPGANIIGSKWVFKAKKDASGKVVRYKACLVVQGFSQVKGVDYFNTYAPVARLPALWAIIAMANCLGLCVV